VSGSEPFQTSPGRQGFDLLLRAYPHLDPISLTMPGDTSHEHDHFVEMRPWLIVKLGQPSADGAAAWAVYEFAVFRHTGAVHRMRDGEVLDPAILTP
jgi:hypothetical protein